MSRHEIEPKPIFFSDNNNASVEARKLLMESGIPFDESMSGRDYKPEPHFTHPTIQGRYGDFRGLGGVQRYIRLAKSDPRKRLP